MDTESISVWIKQALPALAAAVCADVRAHVASLRAEGVEFYGYALIAGEWHDLRGVLPAYNGESDLTVKPGDRDYLMYRLAPDEWKNWDEWTDSQSDPLVDGAVKEFERQLAAAEAALEAKCQALEAADADEDDDDREDPDDLRWKFEDKSHDLTRELSEVLHEAFLEGLAMAKAEGVFGQPDPFLVIWVSDSREKIMKKSVRLLCSPELQKQFSQLLT